MRIVHITTGLGNGGAERTLYKVASQDSSNLHSIISLTKGGRYSDELRHRGLSVVELKFDKSIVGVLTATLKLGKLLRSSSPDIVQTWMYHANLIGGLAARMSGLRYVVWNVRASLPQFRHGSTATWIIARLLAILSRLVPRKIVYCAQRAKEEHENIGYSTSKSVVIPNGFNPTEWSPDSTARRAMRRCLGINQSTRVFGMISRYHPKKNHIGFLEACQEIATLKADFHILLVGPGVDNKNSALADAIERLELEGKVSVLGERTDIPQILNAIDVLVAPSISGEGFPNIVAEAMLTGTPCVVSDTGDAGQIVGENGWILRAGSAEGLSEVLRSALLESTTMLLEKGRRARRSVVARFSERKMSEAYASLYRMP